MFFLEFKRCLRRKPFYIALVIGIGIVIYSYFEKEGRGLIISNQEAFKEFGNIMCEDANKVFMLKARGGFYDLFTIFLPILAAIPYSDSCRDDINSGVLKNIYSRTERKDYLVGKFFANYITSFIVIVTPFIIDAIILKTIFPTYNYEKIFYDMGYVVSEGWMVDLFKYDSNLFMVLSIIIIGLVGATFSSIALSFSYIIKNKYVIVLIPFIIHEIVKTIAVVVFRDNSYLPLGSDFLANSKYTIIFIIFTGILTYIIFTKKGVKYQGV